MRTVTLLLAGFALSNRIISVDHLGTGAPALRHDHHHCRQWYVRFLRRQWPGHENVTEHNLLPRLMVVTPTAMLNLLSLWESVWHDLWLSSLVIGLWEVVDPALREKLACRVRKSEWIGCG